jgi:hypothetical protein
VMAEVVGGLMHRSWFLPVPCHGRLRVAIRSLTVTEGQLKVGNGISGGGTQIRTER